MAAKRDTLVFALTVLVVVQFLLLTQKIPLGSFLESQSPGMVQDASFSRPSDLVPAPNQSSPAFVTYPILRQSLDYDSIETFPLQIVNCFGGGKFPMFMQVTKENKHRTMIDWVCKNRGERRVTYVMENVFLKSPPNSLMLDVGANTGFYGLMAQRMGHLAVQFDLQPTCLTIVRNSVIVNGFQDRGWTIGAGVSDSSTNMTVPDTGCDGRFPVSLREKRMPKRQSTAELHPLSRFISPDTEIMMLKVDTEGNEKRVLAGALDFFKSHKIRNAIVEVTPGAGFWRTVGITKQEVLDVFREIIGYGYWMISLQDLTMHRTPEEVVKYLDEATWEQSDMWLTREERVFAMTGSTLDKTALEE